MSDDTIMQIFTMLLSESPLLAACVVMIPLACAAVVGILVFAWRGSRLVKHHTDNSDVITDAVLRLHGQLDMMQRNFIARLDRVDVDLQKMSDIIKDSQIHIAKVERRVGDIDRRVNECDCVRKNGIEQ